MHIQLGDETIPLSWVKGNDQVTICRQSSGDPGDMDLGTWATALQHACLHPTLQPNNQAGISNLKLLCGAASNVSWRKKCVCIALVG